MIKHSLLYTSRVITLKSLLESALSPSYYSSCVCEQFAKLKTRIKKIKMGCICHGSLQQDKMVFGVEGGF